MDLTPRGRFNPVLAVLTVAAVMGPSMPQARAELLVGRLSPNGLQEKEGEKEGRDALIPALAPGREASPAFGFGPYVGDRGGQDGGSTAEEAKGKPGLRERLVKGAAAAAVILFFPPPVTPPSSPPPLDDRPPPGDTPFPPPTDDLPPPGDTPFPPPTDDRPPASDTPDFPPGDQPPPSPPPQASTPEPGTLLSGVLGSGVVGLFSLYRRRKARARTQVS